MNEKAQVMSMTPQKVFKVSHRNHSSQLLPSQSASPSAADDEDPLEHARRKTFIRKASADDGFRRKGGDSEESPIIADFKRSQKY
jgi:hypothetical protein